MRWRTGGGGQPNARGAKQFKPPLLGVKVGCVGERLHATAQPIVASCLVSESWSDAHSPKSYTGLQPTGCARCMRHAYPFSIIQPAESGSNCDDHFSNFNSSLFGLIIGFLQTHSFDSVRAAWKALGKPCPLPHSIRCRTSASLTAAGTATGRRAIRSCSRRPRAVRMPCTTRARSAPRRSAATARRHSSACPD